MTKKSNKPNITTLCNGVLVAARIRFRGQSPRVLSAQLGPKTYKAYLFNSVTKKVLDDASSEDGIFEALDALRVKLSPGLRSTRGAK